jgi:hypothetical protein
LENKIKELKQKQERGVIHKWMKITKFKKKTKVILEQKEFEFKKKLLENWLNSIKERKLDNHLKWKKILTERNKFNRI